MARSLQSYNAKPHTRVMLSHMQGPQLSPLLVLKKLHLYGTDSEAHQQIMATSDPREQKALGRRVKGFVPAVWDKAGYGVVVEGNLAKFRQNPHFRDELLATGDRVRRFVVVSVLVVAFVPSSC